MLDRHISQEFIEETIAEASSKFTSGHDAHTNFLISSIAPTLLRPASNAKVNQQFVTYDADVVMAPLGRAAAFNLIAAAGPKFETMADFCEEFVFHPTHPVTTIIGIGAKLGYTDELPQDFHDYCLFSRKIQCHRALSDTYEITINNDTQNALGGFTVRNKKWGLIDGVNHSILRVERNRIELLSPTKDSNSQSNNQDALSANNADWLDDARSESGNENANFSSDSLAPNDAGDVRTLDVTILSYDLATKCLQLREKQIPLLWQLYQTSHQQKTLIHCADGKGLTGQLVLTFSIIDNAAVIFQARTPQLAAAAIHRMLTELRKDRVGLVTTLAQFTAAIRTASVLYAYQQDLANTRQLTNLTLPATLAPAMGALSAPSTPIAGPVKPMRSASVPTLSFTGALFASTHYVPPINAGKEEAEAEVLKAVPAHRR